MGAQPFVLSMMITGDSRSAVAAMTEATAASTDLGRASADALAQTQTMADGLNTVQDAATKSLEAVRGTTTALDTLQEKYTPVTAEARDTSAAILEVKEALDGQASAAKRAAEAAVGVRTKTPDLGADITAHGQKLDALRAKFNPLYAAGENYKQALEEIAAAEKAGALSADEATAARNRATVAYKRQAEEIRKADHEAAGNDNGLNRTQKLMLVSAAKHGLESYTAGAPLSTIVSQQGLEIGDALGMGEGGVAGSLSALKGAINPITAALAALAVVIGVTAKAWYDYDQQQRQLAINSAGVGRNIGATVEQLNEIAAASARSSDVSVSAARTLETQLLRTGKVGLSSFAGIIALSKDFATTVGLDAEKAGETLASIFADPAKGAQVLYQQYNLIDGATARQVQRLAETNRLTDAQGVLLAALPSRLVKHEDQLSNLEKVWEGIKKTASDYYALLGGTVAAPKAPLATEIEGIQKDIARRKDMHDRGIDFYDPTNPSNSLAGQEKRLKELQDKEARDREAAEKEHADAQARQKAEFGLNIATRSSATSASRSFQDLNDRKSGLQDALGSGKLVGGDATSAAMALDAVNHALDTYLTESEKANQLAQVDLQIAAARDPVTRADLEARRTRIQLAGQEITTGQAEEQISLARTRALQMSLVQGEAQIATMRDEITARQHVNDLVAGGALNQADANRELQIEQATRPLVIAADRASGDEKQRLLALIKGLTDAMRSLSDEEKRAQALQAIRAGNDQLETTRTEISLIGQSEQARTKAMAALKAEQQIRQMGLATNSAEAASIRSLAQANADASLTLERQRDAWSEVQGAGERALDAIADGLARGRVSMDLFKSVFQDLFATLLRLTVTNPLKNALFGTNLGTLGDAQSVGTGATGILGSLFGRPANDNVAGAASRLAPVTTSALAPLTTLDRSSFNAELADPAIRQRLFAMTDAEVGGQGPMAQQAFMESVFNRASSRGQSISKTLSGDYFPASTYARADQLNGTDLSGKYGDIYNRVQQGSNVSNFATGNATGTVGFGTNGFQTSAFSGEKFGVEAPDLAWAKKFESGMDTATDKVNSFASANGDATKAVTALTDGTTTATKAITGDVGSTSLVNGSVTTSEGGASTGGLGGLFSGIFGSISKVFSSLFSGVGSMFGGLFSGIGSLFGFADGGLISGAGTGTSDSIVARVSHGEFVMNAHATAQHLPLLTALNDNKPLLHFADGGLVDAQAIRGNARIRLVSDNDNSATSNAATIRSQAAINANAMARSQEAAGSKAPNIVVNNYSGADVETTHTRGPSGDDQIEVLVKHVENRLVGKYGLTQPLGRR